MNTKPFVIEQPVSYHADFFVPDGAAKQLLICLHGYGQSKEIALKFGQNIRSNYAIAALQAPYPHFKRQDGKFELGFSWVSDFNADEAILNHHNFIVRVIEEAYRRKLINGKKAIVFGFSQVGT